MRARTFAILAVTALAPLFVGTSSGDAHAGIIVTVGKPSPERCKGEEDGARYRRTDHHEHRAFQSDGTRCVELPGGDVECGQAVRVDSLGSLPRDWRCVAVEPGVLWCETPNVSVLPVGAGPAATPGGSYDPGRGEAANASRTPLDTQLDKGEVMAVGCSGGGLGNLLPLLAGLPLLALCRRRRCS